MRKIIIAALAALCLGAAAAPASGHMVANWGDAYNTGYYYAQNDCGRAWDWWCANIPIAGPSPEQASDHTWVVRTWYQEQYAFPWWSYRVCHTTVWIYHGVTFSVSKYC